MGKESKKFRLVLFKEQIEAIIESGQLYKKMIEYNEDMSEKEKKTNISNCEEMLEIMEKALKEISEGNNTEIEKNK